MTASGASGKPSGELATPWGRLSISAEPTPRGRRAGQDYAPGEDGARASLRFLDEEAPGGGEFVYQAFVIGCASGAADVNATSKSMRRACLAHGVAAFFFNTIILALTIDIGAGLF